MSNFDINVSPQQFQSSMLSKNVNEHEVTRQEERYAFWDIYNEEDLNELKQGEEGVLWAWWSEEKLVDIFWTLELEFGVEHDDRNKKGDCGIV